MFKSSYGIYTLALSSQCKGNSLLVAIIPRVPPLDARADCFLTPHWLYGALGGTGFSISPTKELQCSLCADNYRLRLFGKWK